jgi:bacterioferritin (cytochrome b1)
MELPNVNDDYLDLFKDPQKNLGLMFDAAVKSIMEGIEESLSRYVALEQLLVNKGVLDESDIKNLDKAVAACRAKLDQQAMANFEEVLKMLEQHQPDLAEQVRRLRSPE